MNPVVASARLVASTRGIDLGDALALGAVAVASLALVAAARTRAIRPRTAAYVVMCALVGSAVAVVWTLAGWALPWAAQTLGVADLLVWCDHLYAPHRHVSTVVGLCAAAALVVIGLRIAAVFWARRSLLAEVVPLAEELVADGPRAGRHGSFAGLAPLPPVQVLDDERPRAFAVPGRPGQVVVTSGLLAALATERERQAVEAHERAHLVDGHYRLLLVADLAAAALPFVGPLRARLQFVLERWADESAACEVGDRRVVASAIARCALARRGEAGERSEARAALAMASRGVTARVEALLSPVPRPRADITSAAVVCAAAALGGALLQFRHVVTFLVHHC